ncbi:hypothetical protein DN824_20500 [Stutzerimonas nosocomialis]|uniref:hypothetical protein n=1 Tax=Stutzerimonas nosocomialis TaxID=1056496 RepID=UPI0011081520|nr:hypothetical protein [Stutzerimonas nosocomialis]TLX54865.1 hypothetical protein DN824_20500 [Stutzerimonas nosocomialis]
MSKLKGLFPQAKIVDVAGKKIGIYPVKLRHFEQYGEVAGGLLELLGAASVQNINRYAAQHSKQLMRLLRHTTSLNRWQLWRLPATEAVELMVAVVKENSGFFGEALPGMVRALSGMQSSSA